MIRIQFVLELVLILILYVIYSLVSFEYFIFLMFVALTGMHIKLWWAVTIDDA